MLGHSSKNLSFLLVYQRGDRHYVSIMSVHVDSIAVFGLFPYIVRVTANVGDDLSNSRDGYQEMVILIASTIANALRQEVGHMAKLHQWFACQGKRLPIG